MLCCHELQNLLPVRTGSRRFHATSVKPAGRPLPCPVPLVNLLPAHHAGCSGPATLVARPARRLRCRFVPLDGASDTSQSGSPGSSQLLVGLG
jgi:hypothetical protein